MAGVQLGNLDLLPGQPWNEQLEGHCGQLGDLIIDECTRIFWNDVQVYPQSTSQTLSLAPKAAELRALAFVEEPGCKIKICVGRDSATELAMELAMDLPWMGLNPQEVLYQLNELNFRLSRCRDIWTMKLSDLKQHFARLGKKELSLMASKVVSFLDTGLSEDISRRGLMEFRWRRDREDELSVVLPVLFHDDGSSTFDDGMTLASPIFQVVCLGRSGGSTLEVVSDSPFVIGHFRSMVEECEARQKTLTGLLQDHYDMQDTRVGGPLAKQLFFLCGRECNLRLAVPRNPFLPSRVHMTDLIRLTYRDVPSAQEVHRRVEDVRCFFVANTAGPILHVPGKDVNGYVQYVPTAWQAMRILALVPLEVCAEGTHLPKHYRCLLIRTVGCFLNASLTQIEDAVRFMVHTR